MRQPKWMPNPETIIEDLLRMDADRPTRDGPHTLARIEKAKAGRAAAKARKRAEWWARREAAAPPKPAPVLDRFLALMEPGRWYGLGELSRLVGVDYNVAGRVGQSLRNKRLAERQANPDWIPHDGARGRTKGPIPKGLQLDPKWLYRLTAIGEAQRLAL